jgi:MAF protein
LKYYANTIEYLNYYGCTINTVVTSTIFDLLMSTIQNQHCPILLASSSKYRAKLLAQLGLDFVQAAPNIDESAIDKEMPHDMVSRLSEQKALVLSEQHPMHIIISSDQIAVTQRNEILGKPLTRERAVEQIMQVSGQKLTFLTGLCVLSPLPNSADGWHKQLAVVPYYVHFRPLSLAQINDYITREQPLDCAGAFKVEGLGISLFEKLEGDDPNSLIGLPLIALCSMLANIGRPILGG